MKITLLYAAQPPGSREVGLYFQVEEKFCFLVAKKKELQTNKEHIQDYLSALLLSAQHRTGGPRMIMNRDYPIPFRKNFQHYPGLPTSWESDGIPNAEFEQAIADVEVRMNPFERKHSFRILSCPLAWEPRQEVTIYGLVDGETYVRVVLPKHELDNFNLTRAPEAESVKAFLGKLMVPATIDADSFARSDEPIPFPACKQYDQCGLKLPDNWVSQV